MAPQQPVSYTNLVSNPATHSKSTSTTTTTATSKYFPASKSKADSSLQPVTEPFLVSSRTVSDTDSDEKSSKYGAISSNLVSLNADDIDLYLGE